MKHFGDDRELRYHNADGSKKPMSMMYVPKGGRINPLARNLNDLKDSTAMFSARTADYNPMKHFSDDKELRYHNADGSMKPMSMMYGQRGSGILNDLGLGNYVSGIGITEIHHHHHHHHIGGEGMWDWIDPTKNGIADIFDPKKNGVAKLYYEGVDGAQHIASSLKDLKNKTEEVAREKLERARDLAIKASRQLSNTFTPALGNQILGGLKTGAHYGIPIITGALGTTAGELLSGGNPVAGFAGNQAGKFAGQQLVNKIGVGFKKGRGRPRKIH